MPGGEGPLPAQGSRLKQQGGIHYPRIRGQPFIFERGDDVVGTAEYAQYPCFGRADVPDVMWNELWDQGDGIRGSERSFFAHGNFDITRQYNK